MIGGVATVSSNPIDAEPAAAAGSDGWFAQDHAAVVAALQSDAENGLSGDDVKARLQQHGPNVIRGEAPPSLLQVALVQLREPMNLMLAAVTAVSFVIGEVSTGILIALLVLFNIV